MGTSVSIVSTICTRKSLIITIHHHYATDTCHLTLTTIHTTPHVLAKHYGDESVGELPLWHTGINAEWTTRNNRQLGTVDPTTVARNGLPSTTCTTI